MLHSRRCAHRAMASSVQRAVFVGEQPKHMAMRSFASSSSSGSSNIVSSSPSSSTVKRSFSVTPTNVVSKSSAAATTAADATASKKFVTSSSEEGANPAHLIGVPNYLKDVYWWAYVHPNAVWVFERPWLVDAILWGNFKSLRDAALHELSLGSSSRGTSSSDAISGRTLQIAAVYGDFTNKLLQNMSNDGSSSLDVVDVAPVQIENLHKKLSPLLARAEGNYPNGAVLKTARNQQVRILQQDAAELDLDSNSYDQVILFFLLHEMPADVRRKTMQHVFRVLKPGGKVVLVDYHKPTSPLHPHRYIMPIVLKTLEPFAMDLWRDEIQEWFPDDYQNISLDKELYFGGLYQKVVVTKKQ